MSKTRDVVCPLPCAPADVPASTAARGSVLNSSLIAMRKLGLEREYWEHLPVEHHDAIRGLLVASWVPIEVAHAHYETLDGLGLTQSEMVENGRLVADRVQGTFVGTIIRGLRATGSLSVWNMLKRVDTAWGRLLKGGAAASFRVGPKDAIVELHGASLLNIPYFRAGLEGVAEATLGLITRKVYVKQVHSTTRRDRAALQISWV